MLPHEYKNRTVSDPHWLSLSIGNSNLTDSDSNKRLATFYYTPDGKTAKKQIWDETMKELSFANVEEIVASMK